MIAKQQAYLEVLSHIYKLYLGAIELEQRTNNEVVKAIYQEQKETYLALYKRLEKEYNALD